MVQILISIHTSLIYTNLTIVKLIEEKGCSLETLVEIAFNILEVDVVFVEMYSFSIAEKYEGIGESMVVCENGEPTVVHFLSI